MKCNHCGQELADGLRFCTRCGTKVQLAVSNAVQEAGDEFRVVFERPEQWSVRGYTFVVKVDGVEKCRLKNGEAKEVLLSRGTHQITISIIMCKSKKFTLEVNRDRRIECSYAVGKAAMLNPLLFCPIVAKGENGIKL